MVISARTESLLNETRRECLQYTDKVIAVVGDVGQEQDCAELANAAVEGLGGLDILILNAVYSPPPTFFSDLQNPVSLIITYFLFFSTCMSRHCY